MVNYTLKVLSVKQETPDAVTISFKQPTLKKIKYLPGQYITVIVNINGRKYKRPYSLSSTFGIDPTIDITVKRIPHGIVSNFLNDKIKQDDIIEVIEPIGDFTFISENTNATTFVLWGAGSGITPLFSIIKAALHQNSHKRIILIYCNRDREHSVFLNALNDLMNTYTNFQMYSFFTRDASLENTNFVYNERLNENNLSLILDNFTHCDSHHYICGPESLKHFIKVNLENGGIFTGRIFSEDFEHIVNEEELEDVHTQNVTLNLNKEKFTLEVVRGKSILESALDRDLDLPYSCQNGTCTLCKAKIISGKIKMIGTDIDTSELAEDDCLLCCSYPSSENVEVTIQD